MLYVYSFFMYLLSPWLLFRLWWKGRSLPAYRERIAERFCLGLRSLPKIDIWVHAVSLGEVIAATPLINEMLQKNWSVLITTMTPTGAEQVRVRFGERVQHRYIPYDLPDAIKRFFTAVKPGVGVIIETELWPNLIHQATRAHIPLVLVNARLSERSCQGYQKIKFLIKPLLNQFSGILAQSADDAKRFQELGACAERVAVFGNVKFDLQTKDIDMAMFLNIKSLWGQNRITVIAASTHDNEEEQIFNEWKKLKDSIPDVLLLLAPRHPERFQKVFQMAQQSGFNTGLRSELSSLSPEKEVIILDSMGELLGFYAMSNYAFVGGSFVPVGGHNVLEPIAMGIPVFSGKEVHNFKAICNDLIQANAMVLVDNANDLVEHIKFLHECTGKRDELIKNASQVLEANKGAVGRYMERINLLLQG